MKKTKRIYCLGVGSQTFKFDTLAERNKGVKIVKAAARSFSTWHADKPVKQKRAKKKVSSYVKPKVEDLKYVYGQDVLKSSEGGLGTTDLKRSLKASPIDGVTFSTFSSSYMGHTAFRVYATNSLTMAKAMIRLKELGYVESIKSATRYIQRIK